MLDLPVPQAPMKTNFQVSFTRVTSWHFNINLKALEAKALDCCLALSKSDWNWSQQLTAFIAGRERSPDSGVSRRTRGAELEPTMSRGRDAATGVVERRGAHTLPKESGCTHAHTVVLRFKHTSAFLSLFLSTRFAKLYFSPLGKNTLVLRLSLSLELADDERMTGL